MKRTLFLFAAIAIMSVATGVYFGLQRLQSDAPQNPAVEKLFAQTLPDTQGKPQALAQWKGKTLVVNFWATWCAPCVEEMPELSALQMEISSKNIQIIGIGIDSTKNIVEFSSRYKISYPLYSAGMNGSDLARQFGNKTGGLPFTVIIGADNRIKKTYLGRLKLEQLRADLASL